MTRSITWIFLGFVLLGPLAGRAGEAVRVRGSDVPDQGILTDREIEVTGTPAPSTTPILEIDVPRIEDRAYQITGTVQYREVEGDGYLEMWSHFPDGSRYFSRTLGTVGPMARISGSSAERAFALPFFLDQDTPPPRRLEVNVVLPGRGHVRLANLRLASIAEAGAAPGAWWSPRTGGLVGGIGGSVIGVLGGLIGLFASLGRVRRFVEGALAAVLLVGVVSATAGVVALATGQPYEVYYPLLLSGILDVTIVLGVRGTVRKRYETVELRRMQACDLR